MCSLYRFEAVGKISTDIQHRVVPAGPLSPLLPSALPAGKTTGIWITQRSIWGFLPCRGDTLRR